MGTSQLPAPLKPNPTLLRPPLPSQCSTESREGIFPHPVWYQIFFLLSFCFVWLSLILWLLDFIWHTYFKAPLSPSNQIYSFPTYISHFLALWPNLPISDFLSVTDSDIITIHLIPSTKFCTNISLLQSVLHILLSLPSFHSAAPSGVLLGLCGTSLLPTVPSVMSHAP